MKKTLTFLSLISILSLSFVALPAHADIQSQCSSNRNYGYYTYVSPTSYSTGQNVNFCLVDNTRTPMYSSFSQWQILNSNGSVIYTAPPTSSDPGAYTTGTYYGSWNQHDNAGNQVQPGTYSLIYSGAPNNLSASFTINGNSTQQNYSPYITLGQYTGRQGDNVQVYGHMFAPNEVINLMFNGVPSSRRSINADRNGDFSSSVLVGNMISNTYTISVAGLISGKTVTAPFYVKGYYPTVNPSSYYVLPGNSLSLNGSGFAPHESVILYNGNNLVGNYTADINGNLSLNNVIMISNGQGNSTQTLRLLGTLSQYSMNFQITVGSFYPNISPSSYYVQKGQSFSVNGNGFAPHESVALSFNGMTSQTTADGGGNVNWNVIAPTSGSSYTISATGSWSNKTSSRTITVAQ